MLYVIYVINNNVCKTISMCYKILIVLTLAKGLYGFLFLASLYFLKISVFYNFMEKITKCTQSKQGTF